MITKIYEEKQPDFEVIERKGRGHPDTLSDTLAEELSNVYSHYTKKNFGAILHHNFDKLSILGGKSYVTFNDSYMVKPIRVVVNGRATDKFNETEIPVKQLIYNTVYKFFEERYGEFISQENIRIIYEVSTASTAGAVHMPSDEKNHRHKWFSPDSLEDLPELEELTCNDTSVGCYTPPSELGKFMLEMEDIIYNSDIHEGKIFGTDIKIMSVRFNTKVNITLALPMIARYVDSMDMFIQKKKEIHEYLHNQFSKRFPNWELTLIINPGDNYESGDIYLTHLGSCIETGDEGVVGRGNRVGGLIQVNNPMSMEGACGKNPVYYTGKVLTAVSHEIGNKLADELNTNLFTVYLIGQRRKSLKRPWKIIIQGPQELLDDNYELIEKIYIETLDNMEEITERLIHSKIPLC